MIFEKLIKKEIPFSVGIGTVRLTLADSADGVEHFIIIPHQFRKHLRYGDKMVPVHNLTSEMGLNSEERRWFYKNLGEFSLAISTTAGKVYEHKSKSLTEYMGIKNERIAS